MVGHRRRAACATGIGGRGPPRSRRSHTPATPRAAPPGVWRTRESRARLGEGPSTRVVRRSWRRSTRVRAADRGRRPDRVRGASRAKHAGRVDAQTAPGRLDRAHPDHRRRGGHRRPDATERRDSDSASASASASDSASASASASDSASDSASASDSVSARARDSAGVGVSARASADESVSVSAGEAYCEGGSQTQACGASAGGQP